MSEIPAEKRVKHLQPDQLPNFQWEGEEEEEEGEGGETMGCRLLLPARPLPTQFSEDRRWLHAAIWLVYQE